MIDFVSLSTVQNFQFNPIEDQHKLRYESIKKRQDWDVPSYEELEFDQYDNPAAKYLVYRDENSIAQGSSRFYPTVLPYMLEESFSNFVTDIDIPKSPQIWEGSRFCVNHKLPPFERKKIINYLVVGYLEAGLHAQIDGIVGLMYPAYWRGIFIQAGWPIEFLGDTMRLDDGHKARAAWLPIEEKILNNVRETTGIFETVLNFGDIDEKTEKRAA